LGILNGSKSQDDLNNRLGGGCFLNPGRHRTPRSSTSPRRRCSIFYRARLGMSVCMTNERKKPGYKQDDTNISRSTNRDACCVLRNLIGQLPGKGRERNLLNIGRWPTGEKVTGFREVEVWCIFLEAACREWGTKCSRGTARSIYCTQPRVFCGRGESRARFSTTEKKGQERQSKVRAEAEVGVGRSGHGNVDKPKTKRSQIPSIRPVGPGAPTFSPGPKGAPQITKAHQLLAGQGAYAP